MRNVVVTIADNYIYPAGSNTVYWWGVSDDGTWEKEGNYKFDKYEMLCLNL